MAIGIVGMGAYVPDIEISAKTVATWTGVDASRILDRTGIETRRYAPEEMETSRLALGAVEDMVTTDPDALDDLGAIVVATSTGDQPQPPTAARLHGCLHIPPVAAWDVNAVCAGGVVGLVQGAALAEAAMDGGHVLVVAADKYSAIVSRDDYATASLFGDGAGVVRLGPVPDGYGLRAYRLLTAGAHADLVRVAGGGTRLPLTAKRIQAGADRFRMEGAQVKRWVLDTLPGVIREAVGRAGLELSDVSRFMLHQANPRLLGEVADTLGIDRRRVPSPARQHGNLGAASMFVTLVESHRERPIERGEHIVLAAVGGGMSAGAAVVTWH